MLRPATSPPRLGTLIAMTALSVVSLNLFLPSLPAMALAFETSYGVISLALSGYLAVTAVLQLIIGPLSDRYGRRQVLLCCAGIFVIGSIGAAITDNLVVFLGCRILQGALVAGSTISRAVVRDTLPPQEAAGRLATIGTVMALAPMLGPILGGGLEAGFGWRANFWAFTAMGLALLWVCYTDMGETNLTPQKDFTTQFRAYPDLVTNKVFWGYTACLAGSSGGFFAFLAGAPYVAAQGFGIGPAQIGFAMAATPMGFMLGNIAARRLSDKIGLAQMMVLGRAIAVAGLTPLLIWVLVAPIGPVAYFGGMIFIGIGNGLSMPAGSAGVMSVRADLAGSAAGLSGALMVGLGALLSWITTGLLTADTAKAILLAVIVAISVATLAAAVFTVRAERQERPK